jgi:ribonuclease HI
MAKKNFYAVLRGYRPGIYRAWSGPDGAEAQVKGFPNARYKGFATRREAEAWLKSEPLPKPPPVLTFDLPGLEEHPSIQPDTGEILLPEETLGPAQALASGKVVLYTDGACIGNPGPGGYGVVLLDKDQRKELSGGYHLTTNSRMELTACIVGLQQLKSRRSVLLLSDSRYVINGITRGWARCWWAKGWMRDKESPAQNPDLWEKLLDLCNRHEVQFIWVKGHAGDRENERCDRLAMQAALRQDLPADEYYEPADFI